MAKTIPARAAFAAAATTSGPPPTQGVLTQRSAAAGALAVATAAALFACGPVPALAAGVAGGAHPTSVDELFAHLDALAAPTLGVLSAGNFDSVHHLVPERTTAAVFASDTELVGAVRNGSVDAALMSGLPTSNEGVATFTSTLISPRAAFTCRDAACDTVLEAMDAAIVRALNDGADATAARANPPFEYMTVHSCRTNDVTRFPFPTARAGDRLANASARGALRVAALGPYNWSNSGDFTASPPTGFWPDVTNAIEAHFVTAMGVGFERVWAPTSDAVMDLVLNGTADVTEPYWTVDAFYAGRSRQHTFAPSCTTLGYDSTFVVRAEAAASGSGGGGSDDGLSTGVIVAITLAGTLVVGVPLVAAYVAHRERRLAATYAKFGGASEGAITVNNPVASDDSFTATASV